MSTWSQPITEALGLTLLDSLWQGAILIVFCTLVLTLMRSKPARWRYRLVLACILALPIAGVVTFLGHYEAEVPITATAFEMTDGYIAMPIIETTAVTTEAETPGIIERWQAWSVANAQWVVMLWVIGLALFAMRLTGGFYMVYNLRNSASHIQDEYWTAQLQALVTRLRIQLPVQLKESVKVNSPIVIGYLKPVIIFPLGLLQGLPTDQVEAILLHELAHIKRHDYLINLLVSLLQAVYFYHPAFWWLQKQLDAEREFSCDDLVLGEMSQLSLVKALTAVKEFQMSQYSPALGFASRKNQLLKRVERIMKKKTKTNWLGGLISMSVLLLSFFLMSYRSVSSTEENLLNDALQDDASVELMLQEDSLTVEQAVMQLLNQDEHKLMLELDGDGRLIDLKRNDKQVEKAELKVFQQAHAKLRDYRYSQVKPTEAEADLARKIQELEQYYQSKSDAFYSRQKALEHQKLAEELKRNMEAYQREYEELQRRAREGVVQEIRESNDLDSLLMYYPTLIREYKRGDYGKWELTDSISLTIHKNSYSSSPVIAKFKVAISQMQKRLEELESKGQPLINNRSSNSGGDDQRLKVMVEELIQKQPLSQGKYEFEKESESQKLALRYLFMQGNPGQNVLIELNGEVKEDWTLADVEAIDRRLAIVTVEVIKAENVKEANYQNWMKDRKALIKIKTEMGKRNFVRPGVTKLPSLAEYREIQLLKEELDRQNRQLKVLAEWNKVKQALNNQIDSMKAQHDNDERLDYLLGLLLKEKERINQRMDSLAAQGHIRPVSMEFTESELAQKKALEVLAKSSKSLDRPLVVIDGQIYEDWGVSDINQYDRTRSIASIDLIKAKKVTDEKYKPYMKDRDFLFYVTTKPGKKKYRRPDIEFGILVSPGEIEKQRMENFTKTMLDKLKADGLTPKGWKDLFLSQESFIINGKTQPRKVHKEYLRLYQKLMNKKLGKGVTVELKE